MYGEAHHCGTQQSGVGIPANEKGLGAVILAPDSVELIDGREDRTVFYKR